METVYRVGHRTHRDEYGFPEGPYRVCPDDSAEFHAKQREMALAHQDACHLTPERDPQLRSMHYGEACGFDSVDALNAWFSKKWRTWLASEDFCVWQFSVPTYAVRHGANGQVLFLRNQAMAEDIRPLA